MLTSAFLGLALIIALAAVLSLLAIPGEVRRRDWTMAIAWVAISILLALTSATVRALVEISA